MPPRTLRIDRADPGHARGRADLALVGEVTVAAYAAFTRGPADPYVERLRDAAGRAAQAELWVARDGVAVLGSITSCPPGSPWREVAGDDEGEFRMLSVHPEARNRGVARALVQHVEARWRAAGAGAMAISSLPDMSAAHALYAALGYRRDATRDWSPLPGVDLLAFTKDLT